MKQDWINLTEESHTCGARALLCRMIYDYLRGSEESIREKEKETKEVEKELWDDDEKWLAEVKNQPNWNVIYQKNVNALET